MQTMEVSEARKRINRISEQLVADRVIVVTRRGHKSFAMVDLVYLQSLLGVIDLLGNPEQLRALRESVT